ncbi:MAG: hypothetical protein DYH08_12195 [Actinobacteria bacterium ATB1]|nr:hypothetical protein [Actinobacteria bacterium ATB1]
MRRGRRSRRRGPCRARVGAPGRAGPRTRRPPPPGAFVARRLCPLCSPWTGRSWARRSWTRSFRSWARRSWTRSSRSWARSSRHRMACRLLSARVRPCRPPCRARR